MAITGTDALIAAMAGGVQQSFSWQAQTYNASNALAWAWNSSWVTGYRPGTLAPNAGTATLCDSSTAGAMPLPALTAGNQWYLAHVSALTAGQIALLDRYAHLQLAASTTPQTLAGLALPGRAPSAHGVNFYLEITNAVGATGTVTTLPAANVTYTNSDGVAGRTGTFGAQLSWNYSPPQSGGMFPMALANGDRGVASVQNFTWAAGSPGSTNVVGHLSRTVYSSSGAGGAFAGVQAGFFDIGGTPLGTSPCVFAAGYAAITNVPTYGVARFIQG